METHLEDDGTFTLGGLDCCINDLLLVHSVVLGIVLGTNINTQLVGGHSTVGGGLHLFHVQQGNAFIRVTQHGSLEVTDHFCLTCTTRGFDECNATLDQTPALLVDPSVSCRNVLVGVLGEDCFLHIQRRTEEVVRGVALGFDCSPLECITSASHQELIGVLVLRHGDIPELLGEGTIQNLCGSLACLVQFTCIYNLLEGVEVGVVLLDELLPNASTGK